MPLATFEHPISTYYWIHIILSSCRCMSSPSHCPHTYCHPSTLMFNFCEHYFMPFLHLLLSDSWVFLKTPYGEALSLPFAFPFSCALTHLILTISQEMIVLLPVFSFYRWGNWSCVLKSQFSSAPNFWNWSTLFFLIYFF